MKKVPITSDNNKVNITAQNENEKTNSVNKYKKNETTIKGTNIEAANNFAAADKRAWLYVGNARNETKVMKESSCCGYLIR